MGAAVIAGSGSNAWEANQHLVGQIVEHDDEDNFDEAAAVKIPQPMKPSNTTGNLQLGGLGQASQEIGAA
jgi:hypothetical protein